MVYPQHLLRSNVCLVWGERGMLDEDQRVAWVEGDRAAHYRSVAERLESLADIETKPHVSQRLRELAAQYLELAESVTGQIKRTLGALTSAARSRNTE